MYLNTAQNWDNDKLGKSIVWKYVHLEIGGE